MTVVYDVTAPTIPGSLTATTPTNSPPVLSWAASTDAFSGVDHYDVFRIGGTSLAGGRATIVGTVLGVITFALVFNLLTLMNLAVEIQSITKGLIILAAVLLQRRSN